MMADILKTLASATPTDLRPLQIRLKYVGTQKKSVPAVALTTFHHVLVLNWFSPLRASEGASNDPSTWNFTVTPDEMSRVVKVLATPDLLVALGEEQRPCLSVMVCVKGSRVGDLQFEVSIDREHCSVLMDSLGRALDSNPLAGHVIAQHRQLTCP